MTSFYMFMSLHVIYGTFMHAGWYNEVKRLHDFFILKVDITTLKDYMQYLSLMDETPSYMGGKDNSWRKLTLEGNFPVSR